MPASTLRNPAARHHHSGAFIPSLLATCIALGLLTAQGDAQAAQKKAEQPAAPKKVTVKYQRSPSEESSAERDRRLYRECRGLPNAGACLGYTRR